MDHPSSSPHVNIALVPHHATPLKVWIVDPINYSGMAYYDAGLAGGLARAGADVTVAGSDRPLVRPSHSAGWRLLPVSPRIT